MSINRPLFLCIFKLLLVLLAFILQLIAICTSWWSSFSARLDLGKPEETGHYGLWTLCSTKGPHWLEDCDPLDTFFVLPSYSKVSGIVGVLHLLLLLCFIPLGSIRILQIIKNVTNFGIKAKKVCIIELSLAFISATFAIVVAVLASVGESQREYVVVKGWSFWIQISVIVIDVAITSVCIFTSGRLLQQYLQQQIDPTGNRAETYGNPSFDAESPELSRNSHSSNGNIAFTESSGHPYNSNSIADRKNSKEKEFVKNSKNAVEKNSFQTLTYENECYQESSPTLERANRH